MTTRDTVAWIEAQVDDARAVQEAVRVMAPQLADLAARLADVFRQGGRVYFGDPAS